MSEKKYHFVNRWELLVIIVLLGVSVIAAVLMKFSGRNGSCAVIQCGDSVFTVNLDEPGEFTLDECGDTVFEIADGKIHIKEAVCPDKICAETGFISSPGQSIICVPEKIVITISGESESSVSADVTVG